MVSQIIPAKAHPEKRLFISLLTRDISLTDAFLDLIDNSINAAITANALKLNTASDYAKLAARRPQHRYSIDLELSAKQISISDNCGGIPFRVAREEIFVFGRGSDKNAHKHDRLSVYGIGMKRAIFKMGADVSILSNHKAGGFRANFNVITWQALKQTSWTIPISEYKAPAPYGTTIKIGILNDDVRNRIQDGSFISELKNRIAKSYNYFLGSLIILKVNGTFVESTPLSIGSNIATDQFSADGVTCVIQAGISATTQDHFTYDPAGWYVFCNGRTVLYADKGPQTGWIGGAQYLPLFQPKHRPFLGLVFFVSRDPEALPWTTTKTALNEESTVWQSAKRRMSVVGKQVTRVLDKRYKDDGTEISVSDLKAISGKAVSITKSITAKSSSFVAKKSAPLNETSIQYRVRTRDIAKIRKYLGDSSISNSDVGRLTFDYYLKNEVDE
ncbi:ATP-binding protein [soil metagenome]